MGRMSTAAAIGLAAALAATGSAAAKKRPAPPLTVEVLDHAKLDKRTGVARVRTRITCAPFPNGYRVILSELTGAQGDVPGSGGIGGPIVCDGKRHTYTSKSFAPGYRGEPEPPFVRGEMLVSATVIIDSADGESTRFAQDDEIVRLR